MNKTDYADLVVALTENRKNFDAKALKALFAYPELLNAIGSAVALERMPPKTNQTKKMYLQIIDTIAGTLTQEEIKELEENSELSRVFIELYQLNFRADLGLSIHATIWTKDNTTVDAIVLCVRLIDVDSVFEGEYFCEKAVLKIAHMKKKSSHFEVDGVFVQIEIHGLINKIKKKIQDFVKEEIKNDVFEVFNKYKLLHLLERDVIFKK